MHVVIAYRTDSRKMQIGGNDGAVQAQKNNGRVDQKASEDHDVV